MANPRIRRLRKQVLAEKRQEVLEEDLQHMTVKELLRYVPPVIEFVSESDEDCPKMPEQEEEPIQDDSEEVLIKKDGEESLDEEEKERVKKKTPGKPGRPKKNG